MLTHSERLINYFNKVKSLSIKYKIIGVLCFVLFAMLIVVIPKAFAQPQPVRSVEILSENADYNSKEPGAWKVTKSAKWVEKGVAEITFDVDSIMKTSKDSDVLLVLDISESMSGDKLDRVKADSIELIENLLSNNKNRIGLITFDSNSEIVSDFTNDKDELINSINNLSTKGATNYYKALLNVESVLKNYVRDNDKECTVLFLTDGCPCEGTPNDVGQYNLLKYRYPFVTVNGIQYEMGNSVLSALKNISDNQFIANMNNLTNVLYEASGILVSYDNFEITDYIDADYFYVEGSSAIKVSQGEFFFYNESQKITWSMNNYMGGLKAKMTIKAKLKEDISQDNIFPTNKSEEIRSKIEETSENVVSSKTPILAGKYKVIYDANIPDGCEVSGLVPEAKDYFVFENVAFSNSEMKCSDYQFKGWEIVTKGVASINDDYFIMPEENVVIRAIWSKSSLVKSMDGEVKEYIPATLEKYSYNSTYGLHKYKDSITDIIFQNSMSSIGGAIEVLDISEEKNNGILAYIVPNVDDNTKYTAYIQGDGRIVANSESSHLFENFISLKSIKNLECFDTSNVTFMVSMFDDCNSLTSLDLNSFNTSNVTAMSYMFEGCSGLKSLDVSSFNTAKVTSMTEMFYKCSSLASLDLSNFDTSNVTAMFSMFQECKSLTSLNLSNFNTLQVTNMQSMFSYCNNLRSLDVSNFNTAKVTNMRSMFDGCNELLNLNLSSFNVSNVVFMDSMFRGCKKIINLDLSNFKTLSVKYIAAMFQYCSSLTSLDLSGFNTSQVTNMNAMFEGCTSLTSLDLSRFNTSKVTEMASMFQGCKSLTTTIVIAKVLTRYDSMFEGAATASGAKITVNYTSAVTNVVDNYIGSKSAASNVVKGKLVTV